MRNAILTIALLLQSAIGIAQSALATPLSQLPSGILSGNVYANDALGVVYHFPLGWNTTLDPENARLWDPNPKALANTCTRTLVRIDASGTTDGGFTPWGVFFVIDPSCLPVGPFPSANDKESLKKFADRLYASFKSSPFISPDQTNSLASQSDGRNGPQIVSIRGAVVMPTGKSDPAHPQDPVKLTTLFALTQSKGYWIGWASVADDPARDDLDKNAQVLIRTEATRNHRK